MRTSGRPGVSVQAEATGPPRLLMVEDDANDAEYIVVHILHARTLAEGIALAGTRDVRVVLLDAAGRIESSSAAMRRQLGYRAMEILNQYAVGYVLSEHRAEVQAQFRNLRSTPGGGRHCGCASCTRTAARACWKAAS